MNTDFPTTQARYLDFLTNTPAYLRSSLEGVSGKDRHTCKDLTLGAKRIFFTAAGSSIPAALYGVYELQQLGLSAAFLPTGNILGLQSLKKSDLVVLCSQGMNRADAALVIQAVKAMQARLLVFTANHTTPLVEAANHVIYFSPESEKLFCRPAGVATNLAAMAAALDMPVHADKLIQAWDEGAKSPMTFNKQRRYITLASDMMLPANWNMALAIREGCGILAQNFDIETYAHGNYVGDLASLPYEYIVLDADSSTEAAHSVRRFMPFITATHIPTTFVKAPFPDAARANMYVLGVIARSTYDTNEAHRYNMNIPDGKEQNRYYHELESYDL